MASRREQLVGNRLALAGTVLYFMEWVVIPFAPSLPTDKLGKDPSAIVAAYSHLLEVASYALVAAAGWLAHAQAGAGPIVTLDTAGSLLNLMLFAPLGVSVAAGSLAMLSSRLFPRLLAWIGLVVGALVVCGGILGAAAHDVDHPRPARATLLRPGVQPVPGLALASVRQGAAELHFLREARPLLEKLETLMGAAPSGSFSSTWTNQLF